MKADLSALMQLIEMSDGDIRSCLNTLQFLKNAQKNVTMDELGNAGVKDMQKSMFSVWDAMFVHLNAKEKLKTVNSSKFCNFLFKFRKRSASQVYSAH